MKNAFTLVELLVVMAIIGLLASMLFSLVGSSDSQNDKIETNLLIKRIDGALHQFKTVTGEIALPCGNRGNALAGSWYPSSWDGPWDKQVLLWRLNTEMDLNDRRAAEAYAQAKDLDADPYQNSQYWKDKYPSLNGYQLIPYKEAALDNVSDEEADKHKGSFTGNWSTVTNTTALSHGATGDVPDPYDEHFTKRGGVKKKILKMRATIARDLALRTYQTLDVIDEGEIGKDYIDGDTFIDLWGNPLIYIAHSTAGVEFVKPWTWGGEQGTRIGAEPGGREEVDDRNQDGVIDNDDWLVEPTANKKKDFNGDSVIDVNDWDNMLYNARPTNGRGHYLASAGEDGLFNCLRNTDVNEDNIENELE